MMHYGVGATTATEQAAIQLPKAVLHPANAGDAAIRVAVIKIDRIEKKSIGYWLWANLPGTVPKTAPAAPKQATTRPAQPLYIGI